MEMESDKESPSKLLCTGCLCFGRTLVPLRDEKLKQYYLDIIKEIPLCKTPIQCPSLCLECFALLRKTVAFREQVQDSYKILQEYTSEIQTECHNLDPVDIASTTKSRSKDTEDDEVCIKEEFKHEFVGQEVEEEIETDPLTIETDFNTKEQDSCMNDTDSIADNLYVKDQLKCEDKDEETNLDETQLSVSPLSDSENTTENVADIEKQTQTLFVGLKKTTVKKKKHSNKDFEKEVPEENSGEEEEDMVEEDVAEEDKLLQEKLPQPRILLYLDVYLAWKKDPGILHLTAIRELPAVIGRGGLGGRRQGSGRSRGRVGRVVTHGRVVKHGRVGTHRRVVGDAPPAWKPGNPIKEIYLSDDDVPEELRLQVQAVIERQEDRQRKIVSRRAKLVEDDGLEFFDAEDGDGDIALFSGEEEPLRFNWRPMDSFEGRREPFLVEKTGPKNPCSSAYEAFSQYWDESILAHIVSETNRYAVGKNWSDWYETNMNEILVLFSFWMMLGIIQMPSIKSCFSTNPLLFTNCFRLMFSRQRYERLCSCLHFTDDSLRTPESSPLFPIEPIISHLNFKFQSTYIPRQEICIDESLTLWKGNLSFRQYIKTKAAKFGIKTFELCESSTGYLWSFFVYTGKKTKHDPSLPASLLRSTATVLSLVRPLLNKGYTLFMDNWFNSPLLTRFLKRNKTDVVGSLRPNRQHLPPLVTQCNLRVGEMVARHSGDMSVMAFFDKKKVSLISTYHGTEVGQGPEKSFRPTLWKPKLVLDYNKNMGGIDLKDAMLEAYLLERKRCSRWTMKLFKHLLNVSILNARICFAASTGKDVEHVTFRLELVEQILKENLGKIPKRRQAQESTRSLPYVPAKEWHFPSTVAKRRADGRTCRRRCAVCSKQITFECKSCDVGLCINQCYRKYHVDRF